MTTTTITATDNGLDMMSASTVEATAWAGGTLTAGPGSDSRIGDDFQTPTYYCYVAFIEVNIRKSGIGESEVFSDLDLVVNVDVGGTASSGTVEVYPWSFSRPVVTGDWPTPTEISDMHTAGQLCASTAMSNTYTGDVTIPGTAYFQTLVKDALLADDESIQLLVTTDRHRTAATMVATPNNYFEIEDNVGVPAPDLVVTHAAYDNTGDDDTGTISATDNGTDDCRLRNSNAAYNNARAGAGTFTVSNGLIIGGQASGASYMCYQGFDEYDISSIPAGSTVTDVVLNPYWQATTDVGQWHEWYKLDFGGYPVTTADWQDGTEMAALLTDGNRMFTVDAADTTTANTRASPHSVRAIQLLQESVDNGDATIRMVFISDELRRAVTPTTSVEYGYYDDGSSANPSHLTVYYTPPDPQVNTGILGAIF